jgi:hypothetical protein
VASPLQSSRAFARGAYRLGSARLATRFPGGSSRGRNEVTGFVPGAQSWPSFGIKMAQALTDYNALKGRQAEDDRLRAQVLQENDLRLQGLRQMLTQQPPETYDYTLPNGQRVTGLTGPQLAAAYARDNPAARPAAQGARVPIPEGIAKALQLGPPGDDGMYDNNELLRTIAVRGQNNMMTRFTSGQRMGIWRLVIQGLDKQAKENAEGNFARSGLSDSLNRLKTEALTGDANAAKALKLQDTIDAYRNNPSKSYGGVTGMGGWQKYVEAQAKIAETGIRNRLLDEELAKSGETRQAVLAEMERERGFGEGGELDRGTHPVGRPAEEDTTGAGGISPAAKQVTDSIDRILNAGKPTPGGAPPPRGQPSGGAAPPETPPLETQRFFSNYPMMPPAQIGDTVIGGRGGGGLPSTFGADASTTPAPPAAAPKPGEPGYVAPGFLVGPSRP